MDSSRAPEPCRAGSHSETADAGRREPQQHDPQRASPVGPWEEVCGLGTEEVAISVSRVKTGRRADAIGKHTHVLGNLGPPVWHRPALGMFVVAGAGGNEQSVARHRPGACQLTGAVCRGPQLTGTMAASPGRLAQPPRVPPGPGTHRLARC